MSDDNNREIENLLKNIQEGLKKFSVKELNSAIIKILNKKEDKTREIDYVLNAVCNEYSISRSTLKNKNVRGTLQEAKQITYCLLHFNLGLSIRYIANRVFDNWPTSVSIGIQRYKKADITHKEDKKFVDKYVKLEKKLINKIAYAEKN